MQQFKSAPRQGRDVQDLTPAPPYHLTKPKVHLTEPKIPGVYASAALPVAMPVVGGAPSQRLPFQAKLQSLPRTCRGVLSIEELSSLHPLADRRQAQMDTRRYDCQARYHASVRGAGLRRICNSRFAFRSGDHFASSRIAVSGGTLSLCFA